ncbi:uncharacterized protein LOC135816801 [Sycon ciliatum]|uniref:uncharacterized protein LOC135816801 n=1 Tax=Sycon ciliatum TaxID=27933 RepID=UPI0031F6F9DE
MLHALKPVVPTTAPACNALLLLVSLSHTILCWSLLVVGTVSLGAAAATDAGYTVKSNAFVGLDVQQASVTTTLPWYRGFTSDWWRSNERTQRCDNGAKWGHSGLLTADLQNARLRYLATRLSPAVWRIGGTPQDEIVYVIGNPPECASSKSVQESLAAPGPLCLTMGRWKEIVEFADSCGLKLVMGLNGMYARTRQDEPFNITNTREFLRFTAESGLSVFAFELSNERLRRAGGATPKVLAQDFTRVRQLIVQFWPDKTTRPMLLGPDSSEKQLKHVRWFAKQIDGGVLDGLSYHSYCSGVCRCGAPMTQPAALHTCLNSAKYFLQLARTTNPATLRVWASEVGPHHCGGLTNCSDRFMTSFWYLHHLGSLARMGIEVFARSTLMGADYGLLDKASFHPRPDYFAALLWGRLMCRHHYHDVTVGSMDGNSVESQDALKLLAFACRSAAETQASNHITLLLINLSPEEVLTVYVKLLGWKPSGKRLEYHVSASSQLAPEARMKTQNGDWIPLRLSADDKLPDMAPIVSKYSDPVIMSRSSYAFIRIDGHYEDARYTLYFTYHIVIAALLALLLLYVRPRRRWLLR